MEGPVDPSELSGTLDVWGFGTEDPVGEVRVKAFEKAFPNVEVKLTPGDFDEQKFLSAVAAGNPPDVVHIDRGLVGSYAARGALVALDDYVTASELDLGVYLPAALEQVQLDGATYGLPEFNNVIVAYLNNGALEEAGLSPEAVKFGDWQTMAQINADLAKMSGGDPARVGFDPRMPDMLPLWADANGGALVSEDGTESLLDTPEVVETVAFAAELLDPSAGSRSTRRSPRAWTSSASRTRWWLTRSASRCSSSGTWASSARCLPTSTSPWFPSRRTTPESRSASPVACPWQCPVTRTMLVRPSSSPSS
ncbi:MAG: extracellular solute-binding protein [Actinomycetota bacterium]|nr:extracellular solute-binding protein [Actinomycetota bacterium]